MATSVEALQNMAKLKENALRGSSTAYAPNTAPTSSDMRTATELSSLQKQIEKLKSEQLRNRWYGASDVPVEGAGESKGVFMSGLAALQRPMNAIVGAGQYALGKGTESSLVGNINEAMKTGLTSGNVLQQMGVKNRAVQIPLGFMLDVMLDPINWLTMGTAALIPRVGAGLVRGGFKKAAIEGLETGLEAGAKNVAKTKTGLESGIEGFSSLKSQIGADAAKLKGFVGEKVSDIGSVVGSGWDAKKALGAGVTGLTSNLQKKAAIAMRLVPFAKKSATYKSWMEKISQKAITGAEKYDVLMGKDVYSKLGKGLFGMPAGAIGNTLENLVRKVPSVKILGKQLVSGDEIADFFKYSTSEAAKVTDLYDDVLKLGANEGAILGYTKSGPFFKNIEDFLDANAKVKVSDLTKKLADAVIGDADGMVAIRNVAGELKPEFMSQIHVTNTIDNAKTLLDMARKDYNMKHLVTAYKVTPVGKTGVAWYDDFITKVKDTNYNDIVNFVRKKIGMDPLQIEQAVVEDSQKMVKAWNSIHAVKSNLAELPGELKSIRPGEWKPFEKILNFLEEVTNIFKPFKVAMNPPSFVAAALGNVTMGLMEGLPMYNKKYLSMLVESRQLLKGKLSIKDLKDLFFNDVNMFIHLGTENPTRFKEIFGFHPNEIIEKVNIGETVRKIYPNRFADVVHETLRQSWDELEETLGIVGKGTDEVEQILAKIELGESFAEGLTKVEKNILKESMGTFRTPTETNRLAAAQGPLPHAEEIGTFTTTELVQGRLLENLKLKLASKLKGEPNNLMNVYLDKFFNGMPKAYEHIDQSFKITTTNFLTRVGVNEQQLIKLSQFVPISKADLLEPVISGGEKLFRLQPLKAGEVALETFMNYAAMPDFVKVIRALPIVGSNFYSFQYAMAIKTAKTAINNPALFNKVGFAINELNAGRTPQEKAALEDKYNQYLKSPTVVKMFGMWNLELRNWIPYLTMNIFNPSEKTYDDSIQGQVLKILDKTPLFQTPGGQVVKDYWIQPWVLAGTDQVPQGQFSQPILPYYDESGKRITPSLGTQAFYQTRTFLESLVPGVASYFGWPLGLMGVSPEVAKWIPSYGVRSILGATQGRSSVGAMTKEDSVRKTLRALLGRTGVPAYTLDPTKTSIKK